MSMDSAAARAATRSALFGGIDAVSARLASQVEADERGGTLSAASVEALVETGVLRMKLPKVLGGFEADLVTQMEALERLANINASVGWCAMVGATSLALPGAFLSDEGLARMFGDGRMPRGAIVVTPSGTVTPVAGGYRVTGRWSFASGIRHADWLVAICRETPAPAEGPGLRWVVVPSSDCLIHDNWQVVGLRGTGSCDVELQDLFVPSALSFGAGEAPRRGGALYAIGLPTFVAYEHAGFALGVARRALDGVVEILRNKRRGYAPGGVGVADRGALQHLLGRAETRLRAARALAIEVNEAAWEAASAGRGVDAAQHCEVRSAATYATEVAVDVVNDLFRHAGAAAIFDHHFMQRCLRDVTVAAQHYMVADTAYELLGRARLGIAEVNPMG